MIFFISKTLIRRHVFASSPTHKLCILKLSPISQSISTCSIHPNQHSFQVSYLVNSCGFSPESALKTRKRVKFDSPEKPDAVLAFFKKNGFSETQVSKLIKAMPQLITADPEKTLLPKLQFFYSKGISVPDLAKILSSDPNILIRSLENQLIPTFDFFTKFLQSEVKTITAIKRFPSALMYDFQRNVVPIIDILRNYGVPESNIMLLLARQPRVFRLTSTEKFTEIIKELEKMGFDPSMVSFVTAVHALRGMSKPTWENKLAVYKRWGWSHKETLHAFRKNPWCMTFSEENISAKMDFFVNKMDWDPSFIASRPLYLTLSLQKRIIPRCSVFVELLSKGLIKKKYGIGSLLNITEKSFLQKYVYCYEDEAPHLLAIYHKKLGEEREVIDP